MTNAHVTLEARVLGQKPSLTEAWLWTLPVKAEGEGLTLRQFIEGVVRDEVAAFMERQEKRRFEQVLSARQIAQGAAHGKVDMGGSDLQQQVDADEAVGNALTAFSDGLYLVLIDGRQQTDLDEPAPIRAGSRVTIVRLVGLAGG